MKARTIVLTLVTCVVGLTMCWAEDAFMGTWKLNESKSKISAGSQKNTNVVYEATGDNVKVSSDGIGGDGSPTHIEWTGKLDGKDYPVTGDPSADMRSYKKLNDHTLELTSKKAGNVTVTGRITVSADGKTRTVNTNGTDASGKAFHNTAVFDKQ
jgi:hypothetical protein